MRLKIKIITIAILCLGISLGLFVYLSGYLTKSKAAAAVAHLEFASKKIVAKTNDKVHADLAITAPVGISALNIIFTTTGTNLAFSFTDTAAHVPAGYVLVLDEPTMISDTKTLEKVTLVSKSAAAALPKSALIPLYFTVSGAGQAGEKTVLAVDLVSSQIVGASDVTAVTGFALEGDVLPLTFTVSLDDSRAASATGLDCDMAQNLSRAACGIGTAIKWNDVGNEDGYKIYKNNQLVATLAKDATSYFNVGCPNFNPNTYSVIAYNANGSVSTTSPAVSCRCMVCPTAPPLTPTPVPPVSSADLILRAVFPDADPSVNQIPNVTITILDNGGGHICADGTDCAKTVTFYRVADSKVPNTFSPMQLQYSTLTKNQAYSVVIKQEHTLKQTYKNVYLKWLKVLQCNEGTQDSGCGDLIEGVATQPLFSGDLDKSNKIDQADLDIVSKNIGTNSVAGDLNFDGVTDTKDVDIVAKNFNKSGT